MASEQLSNHEVAALPRMPCILQHSSVQYCIQYCIMQGQNCKAGSQCTVLMFQGYHVTAKVWLRCKRCVHLQEDSEESGSDTGDTDAPEETSLFHASQMYVEYQSNSDADADDSDYDPAEFSEEPTDEESSSADGVPLTSMHAHFLRNPCYPTHAETSMHVSSSAACLFPGAILLYHLAQACNAYVCSCRSVRCRCRDRNSDM
jgi:hypothetical protein